MKLGMVLISGILNPARAEVVKRSFDSLSKTDVMGLERPVMELMIHPYEFDYEGYRKAWEEKWDVIIEPDAAQGLNSLVSVCGDRIAEKTDATHVVFMYDDFLYNAQWMKQLCALIERHPDARAWSVYRSSYERHHRILSGDGVDVVMTMHDGLGCMTVQEWREYGASKISYFECPESMGGGSTIDIHHAYVRPGERWATGMDYWENLGVHADLGRRDQAIQFVGE